MKMYLKILVKCSMSYLAIWLPVKKIFATSHEKTFFNNLFKKKKPFPSYNFVTSMSLF